MSNLTSVTNRKKRNLKDAEAFINGEDSNRKKKSTAEPVRRLNVEVTASMHKKLRQEAAAQDCTIRDLVIAALDNFTSKSESEKEAALDRARTQEQ